LETPGTEIVAAEKTSHAGLVAGNVTGKNTHTDADGVSATGVGDT
jgi:hypothetical protein